MDVRGTFTDVIGNTPFEADASYRDTLPDLQNGLAAP